MMSQTKKVGIYSGTFDPVHHGHLAFARRAAAELGLEQVYFLVEPRPRHKSAPSDLRHRLNMVWLALQDYPELSLLPLNQPQFSVSETLPWLEQKFATAELHLLMGTDLFNHAHNWPGFDRLQQRVKLIVGQRHQETASDRLPHQLIKAELQELTSTLVRACQTTQLASLVPEPVQRYISAQGLYSAANSVSTTSSSVSKSL